MKARWKQYSFYPQIITHVAKRQLPGFPIGEVLRLEKKGASSAFGGPGLLGDPEPAPAVLELEEVLPDCPSALVFSIFQFLCVLGTSGKAGEAT